ncbi:Sua5/YciO/YrdC/YwlC family protein, partial [Escherichia coli]|nr:Sua5/YciO/YrdC/YwlC family protein [Escherichia coli]
HVAQKSDLEWVSDKPFQLAKDLVDEFWPGPLTIILFKSDRISTFATAGSSSLAVRMPAAEMALSLIQKVGAPLVAPSANPFTRISPTTAIQV